MHILTLSSLYPNSLQPVHAVFVRARMERFAQRHGHQLTVVAPVPYYPKLPFPTLATYDRLARVPSLETDRGYSLYHPRYLLTPKVGMRWYGDAMAAGVTRLVRKIHAATPIDVIDGHYIFPDGVAAVRLGKELGIPVILSARGTDLNLYPRFPVIRERIRKTLQQSRHLICVCGELRAVAQELGLPHERISVIGNGVDTQLFHPGDAALARQKLGLPMGPKVLLSVGHLTERKGFHLVIEALAALPDKTIRLCLAGDGPQRNELETLARRLGVSDRVLFGGAVGNRDLPTWYHAADFFILASSREGWPNVLCEAQACGLPAIATRVWGIPEILSRAELGMLVPERSAAALASALQKALATTWDRDAIAKTGMSRTWDQVADELEPVFQAALKPIRPNTF
jgi:teichuronic acid biosynthesis glycosyltransferase TuaC